MNIQTFFQLNYGVYITTTLDGGKACGLCDQQHHADYRGTGHLCGERQSRQLYPRTVSKRRENLPFQSWEKRQILR